jgi:hypothetical protein
MRINIGKQKKSTFQTGLNKNSSITASDGVTPKHLGSLGSQAKMNDNTTASDSHGHLRHNMRQVTNIITEKVNNRHK